MADPADMIIPLLREMRQDITWRLDKVETRLTQVDARLDKMDQSLVTSRQALSADSLLSEIVTGEFEERLSDLERR